MKDVIRSLIGPAFVIGLICLSIETRSTNGPSWRNHFWVQDIHWYGAGLIILGIILFLEGFIVKASFLKSKRKYLYLLLTPLIIISIIFGPELVRKSYPIENDSPIGMLKAIQAAEAMWRQNDIDGNGIQDYWTYDLSGMYRTLKNGKPTCYINIDFAKADTGWHKDGTFGAGITEDWNPISVTLGPKSGYYYQAILTDEDGIPYNQNWVRGVKATNSTKFAFVAYPMVYGSSGDRTFIINERGVIYATDCGSDEAKIILKWPGKYPELIKGPGGKYWMPTGS
jgi:hypothetical protein